METRLQTNSKKFKFLVRGAFDDGKNWLFFPESANLGFGIGIKPKPQIWSARYDEKISQCIWKKGFLFFELTDHKTI